ncbi:MAG: SorB family sulfite dehydrogenase c-type cytochrome subunit [Limisphaerales bacterium]
MPAASHLNAGPVKIELPPETASFKPASGSALANGQCLTCHSMEYVLTQPPMPRTFWASEVKKMRQTYGASITEEQIEPLVSYLAENFGVRTNTQPIVIAPGTDLKSVPATAQILNVEALATKYGCLGCHNVKVKIVGPAYKDVAAKYRNDPAGLDKIILQIHNGGSGKWGPVLMPPFPTLTDAEARMLAVWIMRQGPSK